MRLTFHFMLGVFVGWLVNLATVWAYSAAVDFDSLDAAGWNIEAPKELPENYETGDQAKINLLDFDNPHNYFAPGERGFTVTPGDDWYEMNERYQRPQVLEAVKRFPEFRIPVLIFGEYKTDVGRVVAFVIDSRQAGFIAGRPRSDGRGFFSAPYWKCRTCWLFERLDKAPEKFRLILKQKAQHDNRGPINLRPYDMVALYRQPTTWSDYSPTPTYADLAGYPANCHVEVWLKPDMLEYNYLEYRAVLPAPEDARAPLEQERWVHDRIGSHPAVVAKMLAEIQQLPISDKLRCLGTDRPGRITPKQFYECKGYLPFDRSPLDMQYGPLRYEFKVGPWAATEEVRCDLVPYFPTSSQTMAFEEAQVIEEAATDWLLTNQGFDRAFGIEGRTYPKLEELIKARQEAVSSIYIRYPWLKGY